jgi:hypothetical protein
VFDDVLLLFAEAGGGSVPFIFLDSLFFLEDLLFKEVRKELEESLEKQHEYPMIFHFGRSEKEIAETRSLTKTWTECNPSRGTTSFPRTTLVMNFRENSTTGGEKRPPGGEKAKQCRVGYFSLSKTARIHATPAPRE